MIIDVPAAAAPPPVVHVGHYLGHYLLVLYPVPSQIHPACPLVLAVHLDLFVAHQITISCGGCVDIIIHSNWRSQ